MSKNNAQAENQAKNTKKNAGLLPKQARYYANYTSEADNNNKQQTTYLP